MSDLADRLDATAGALDWLAPALAADVREAAERLRFQEAALIAATESVGPMLDHMRETILVDRTEFKHRAREAEAEVERLRGVLAFYADPRNYSPSLILGVTEMSYDRGGRARAAIAGMRARAAIAAAGGPPTKETNPHDGP